MRFTDRTSKQSRVKVMTDGILLAELQRDRDLQRYDTIIIDEAHERSLNVDFLLGYLKRLLPRRPDLKVVITSATIDPERFAEHFADERVAPRRSSRSPAAPTRSRCATGRCSRSRTTTRRASPSSATRPRRSRTRSTSCSATLPATSSSSSPASARSATPPTCSTAPAGGTAGFDIVPLYSRLSAAEQHRVFERHSRRRVVLATNVAETSLTVPGITGVIDTGLARISRWSSRTKVQRLPIEPVSQASAQQRSGRCGRVEAGIASGSTAEEDFEARPEFTDRRSCAPRWPA